jgi:tRNA (mo5U34)-methyltransferase
MIALSGLSTSLRQSPLYRGAVRPVLKRLMGSPHPPQAGTATAEPPAVVTRVFFPRPASLPDAASADSELLQQIGAHHWYHTLDLGDGIVTPGFYDHTPALDYFPLPKDLSGKRCLDVATFDGFWAFEMERRGAAEVVGLDIDSWLDLDLPDYYKKSQLLERAGPVLTTGAGFKLAHQRLGSKVQRRICNVYDLSPEEFGQFDVVFCGDLLLHLTNPLHAMQRIFSVTKGEAYFMEPYLPATVNGGPVIYLDADLSDCHWWRFGHDFLEQAARSAGFTDIEVRDDLDIRTRTYPAQPVPRIILRARP